MTPVPPGIVHEFEDALPYTLRLGGTSAAPLDVVTEDLPVPSHRLIPWHGRDRIRRETTWKVPPDILDPPLSWNRSVSAQVADGLPKRHSPTDCNAGPRVSQSCEVAPFGAKSALDYLIGEKLLSLAEEAERRPEFARELPRFLAAVWRIFNQYELAGYVVSRKPAARKKLRNLLYVR